MSTWTDFRDSLEADLEPQIAKGIAFLHALETLAEGSAIGDVEAAAIAGVSAGESATGDIDAKLLVAVEAFASALVGYGVTIVKTAASEVETLAAPAA